MSEQDPTQNTKEWIETKINSLRSEMRTLFVVAVAGNQLLSHVSISPTMGYVGSGGLLVGAILLKTLSFWGL